MNEQIVSYFSVCLQLNSAAGCNIYQERLIIPNASGPAGPLESTVSPLGVPIQSSLYSPYREIKHKASVQ